MYTSDYVILGAIKPCAGKKVSGKDENNWKSRKYDMVRRTVEYSTDFVVFDIVIKSKLCRMRNVTSQTKSFIGEIKDAKCPSDFQILRLSKNFLVN